MAFGKLVALMEQRKIWCMLPQRHSWGRDGGESDNNSQASYISVANIVLMDLARDVPGDPFRNLSPVSFSVKNILFPFGEREERAQSPLLLPLLAQL